MNRNTVTVVPNSKCRMQFLLADLITHYSRQQLNVLVIRTHAYRSKERMITGRNMIEIASYE